jgi:hypothetical protein
LLQLTSVVMGPCFRRDDNVVASLLEISNNGAQAPAILRRDAPKLCMKVVPQKNRGRRECRVPAAPAASRAK